MSARDHGRLQNRDGRAATAWPSTQGSLLLRLRGSGDSFAWKTFVDIYSPLVYAFCRKRGVQHADASDVTQDVFLKLNDAMSKFEYMPESGSFRAWLGTVTRNVMRRHYQRSHSRSRGVEGGMTKQLAETQLSTDDELWDAQFNDHLLRTALDRIRPEFSTETWRAFEMLWIEERTVPDVASALNRNRNWLYKAKHHVIQRLEQEVLFLADDIPRFHQ